MLGRQRTVLDRVIRGIGRKLDTLDETARQRLRLQVEWVEQIWRQRPMDKGKLYLAQQAWPKTWCINSL